MTYIVTYSGKELDFENPSLDDIVIEDIATALSRETRFAGHCDHFYSVAQHSVLASFNIAPEFAFEALMHDAHEAYCKDIPSPLKALIPDYKRVAARIDTAIREKFDMLPTMPPEVHDVDMRMLATERRDLLSVSLDGRHDGWVCLDGYDPFDFRVIPYSPDSAKELFLYQFYSLYTRKREQNGK